jgi:4-amino-4-deoxy-L-arabinose transferase-like glycosyltransferase
VRRWVAIVGGLFLLTIPVVYYHSTIGYVNLPFTALIVAGALTLLNGWWQESKCQTWLGGILLAAAAWTRPEGLLYSISILTSLALVYYLLNRKLPALLPGALPVAFVILIWFPFARSGISDSHLGGAMCEAINGFLVGDFHRNYATLLITIFSKRVLQPENWGYFLPVVAFLIAFAIPRVLKSPSSYDLALIVVTVIMGLMPFGLFYVNSYIKPIDLYEELVIRSFDRAFFPGAIMLFTSLLSVFGNRPAQTEQSRTVQEAG